MGQKLKDFFDEAKQIGGIKAQMRLAMITKTSSAKAVGEPDSPDNIAKFQAAIKEIKKEF